MVIFSVLYIRRTSSLCTSHVNTYIVMTIDLMTNAMLVLDIYQMISRASAGINTKHIDMIQYAKPIKKKLTARLETQRSGQG